MKNLSKRIGILTAGLLLVISCESNPINNNETNPVSDPTAGIPADQINWVSWKPEVTEAIRVQPDTARTGLARQGSSFAYITYADGGTVGGADTYGNQVWFPPGMIAYDSYVGVQAACSNDETFFSDLSALGYIDAAVEHLDLLATVLAGTDQYIYIDLAYQGLSRTRAFFAVYANHSDAIAFEILRTYVILQMQAAAVDAANGLIDPALIPSFRYVSQLAALTAQTMAASTLIFANNLPDPIYQHIQSSGTCYSYGNAFLAIDFAPLSGLNVEWYQYANAVQYYQYAWIFAQAAIPLNDGACSAAVDYLPSQNFNGPVEVTLSWGALDFNGNPDELVVYWYNEETELWVLISDPVIDYETQTISVWVDHFTRFGWGIGGEEPIGD